jgi:hypothetical protein
MKADTGTSTVARGIAGTFLLANHFCRKALDWLYLRQVSCLGITFYE